MTEIKASRQKFLPGEFLQTDFHSHVIPGIDDGSQDLQLSITLVKGLLALGYKKLIFTPHINANYPNTEKSIQDPYVKLVERLQQEGIQVETAYAAEHMISHKFEEMVNKQELLTLGDTAYVLMETPFSIFPANFYDLVFNMQVKGYQPILAHPERYHYIHKPEQLDAIKEREVLFQSNLLSFTGYYGERERDIAENLLKRGMIDFLCTDLHHVNHLNALMEFKVSKKVIELIQKTPFKNAAL